MQAYNAAHYGLDVDAGYTGCCGFKPEVFNDLLRADIGHYGDAADHARGEVFGCRSFPPPGVFSRLMCNRQNDHL